MAVTAPSPEKNTSGDLPKIAASINTSPIKLMINLINKVITV